MTLEKILLFTTLLCICSCASLTPPKTASEFRSLCKGREGYKSVMVRAPIETVVTRITQHANKCNSFGYKQSRRGSSSNPAGFSYSDRQLIRWEKRSSNLTTFVIAMEGKQDLNRQKGGFFVHVIDLKTKGDQTSVDLYWPHIWGYYDFNSEFENVVAGKKASCQYELAFQ